MSRHNSASTPAATPPLWAPEPAVFPSAAAARALGECFPALVGVPPHRAVLLVPDGGLYLCFRMLRIFHEAGVAVDLLCPRGHPLKHSRYIRQVCECADWADVERKFGRLLGHPSRPWRRTLVAHEPSVRRLLDSLDADALAAWQPGLTAPGVREFYHGKFGLPAAQARWGLPLPPNRICHNADELRAFAVEIGGPVIVKPSDKLGGIGIRKFNDAAAVDAARAELSFPLLAQKFITGQRVVLDLFCSNRRLLGWLSSRSIAQANGPFTYSTGRHFRAMPQLRALAELIAAEGRMEGFCGVDCLEEAGTGRVYMLEFNPRLSSGWRFGRHCGVDFALAAAAWAEGVTLAEPLAVPAECDVRAHYFPSDLFGCLRRRDWRGLQNWRPGANSRHDICWDDPLVFVAWLGGRLIRRLRKLITSKAGAVGAAAPVKP